MKKKITNRDLKAEIKGVIEWAKDYALGESARHADWHEVEHVPAFTFIDKKLLPRLRKLLK